MRSRSALVTIALAVALAAPRAVHAAPPGDACALLTPAQVGSASGVAVGAGTYVTPTFKRTCTWTVTKPAPKSTKFVTLFLQDANAFSAGKLTGAKSVFVTSVSGIGDDAYYLAVGPNVGLIVKKGAIAFKVAVYGDISLDQKKAMEKTLAQQVLAKL